MFQETTDTQREVVGGERQLWKLQHVW